MMMNNRIIMNGKDVILVYYEVLFRYSFAAIDGNH